MKSSIFLITCLLPFVLRAEQNPQGVNQWQQAPGQQAPGQQAPQYPQQIPQPVTRPQQPQVPPQPSIPPGAPPETSEQIDLKLEKVDEQPQIPKPPEEVTAYKKPWSVTPSVLITFPHPLNFALDGRYNDLGGGITGGGLGYTFKGTSPPIELSTKNFEARARWFPFHGSLFIGAGFGTQTLTAKGTKDIVVTTPVSATVPTTAKVTIKGTYLKPHFGWMWVWGPGFTLGFELGVHLPISPENTLEVTTEDAFSGLLETVKTLSDFKALEQDINSKAKQAGKQILPVITLLRLGWTF